MPSTLVASEADIVRGFPNERLPLGFECVVDRSETVRQCNSLVAQRSAQHVLDSNTRR